MCIFWFDGRVGSLGGREQAVQAEKKGLPIELESDSISGWNLTQAYNNRLDLGAYRTYYKGFTCFFNNTVLRGAGLNGCAIFVRKYWDRTV